MGSFCLFNTLSFGAWTALLFMFRNTIAVQGPEYSKMNAYDFSEDNYSGNAAALPTAQNVGDVVDVNLDDGDDTHTF
jgi:hypothetical protein